MYKSKLSRIFSDSIDPVEFLSIKPSLFLEADSPATKPAAKPKNATAADLYSRVHSGANRRKRDPNTSKMRSDTFDQMAQLYIKWANAAARAGDKVSGQFMEILMDTLERGSKKRPEIFKDPNNPKNPLTIDVIRKLGYVPIPVLPDIVRDMEEAVSRLFSENGIAIDSKSKDEVAEYNDEIRRSPSVKYSINNKDFEIDFSATNERIIKQFQDLSNETGNIEIVNELKQEIKRLTAEGDTITYNGKPVEIKGDRFAPYAARLAAWNLVAKWKERKFDPTKIVKDDLKTAAANLKRLVDRDAVWIADRDKAKPGLRKRYFERIIEQITKIVGLFDGKIGPKHAKTIKNYIKTKVLSQMLKSSRVEIDTPRDKWPVELKTALSSINKLIRKLNKDAGGVAESVDDRKEWKVVLPVGSQKMVFLTLAKTPNKALCNAVHRSASHQGLTSDKRVWDALKTATALRHSIPINHDEIIDRMIWDYVIEPHPFDFD